jgi:hypothetical protein
MSLPECLTYLDIYHESGLPDPYLLNISNFLPVGVDII